MLSESVVIAVVPRDRFSMFPRCLEALYAHTHVRFRVIVVAGRADITTKEYLHQLHAKKDNMSVLLVDRLLMPGEARNLALRQSNERFCILLENDTMVHENWLPPMLECMREEGAAVVTPLVWWYRGIHTAGCMFEERGKNGAIVFSHKIMYTGIRRKRIDYPENHCILIDRQLLPGIDIFDDVEPFDVDLGLTLRKSGLSVFFEPRSVVTYSAPPPLQIRDIPPSSFAGTGHRGRLVTSGLRRNGQSRTIRRRNSLPTEGSSSSWDLPVGIRPKLRLGCRTLFSAWQTVSSRWLHEHARLVPRVILNSLGLSKKRTPV